MYDSNELPIHAAIESACDEMSFESVRETIDNILSEKNFDALEKKDEDGKTFLNFLLDQNEEVRREVTNEFLKILALHDFRAKRVKSYEFDSEIWKKLLDNTFSEVDTFEQNVKKWKKLFGMKSIKMMFDDDRMNNMKFLLPLFYNANFVQSFLTRSVEKEVSFNEDNALILSKYEDTIYSEGSKHSGKIPYRAASTFQEGRLHYFKGGGDRVAQKTLEKKLDDELSGLSGECDVWTAKLGYTMQEMIKFCKSDFHELKEFKHPKSSNSNDGKTYLILPVDMSRHAVLFVGVVGNEIVEGRRCMDALIMFDSIGDQASDAHKINMLAESKFKYGKDPVFIDASLKIQNKILNDTKDENCMIYRVDYALAFIKALINNPELKKRVESVSRDSVKQLERDIRKELKAHLPMYFSVDSNGKYKKKPAAEVIDYFRKKRWNIGNQYIESGKLVNKAKPRKY